MYIIAFSIKIQVVLHLKGNTILNDKKNEKDLSILDNQDVEIEKTAIETVEGETLEQTEKKKVKPWIIFTTIALILAIIAVGVFSWFQYTTLATYEGGRVTRAELNKYIRTTLLAQGVTEDDITDMDLLEDNLLVSLANEEVFYQMLENLGVAQMTQDEIDALEIDSRTLLDEYVEANIETVVLGLPEGYSDADLEKAKKEFEINALNGIGCESFKDFVDIRVKETIITNAYDELISAEDVTPTEEEVKAEYDAILAAQVETYSADPSIYLLEAGNVDLPLYVPEGIRLVRHVLILTSEESQNEIYALEMEGKIEEATAAHEAALAEIKPQMDEVLSLLDSGEMTFTEAIDKYNQDEGMIYFPDGYEVCEGFDQYVPEFTEAALALEKAGDYSGLVSTTYGYHIIEYYKDIESSTVPFEDVSAYIESALTEMNKSDVWYSYLDTWPVELNLQFKDKSLNDLDIY